MKKTGEKKGHQSALIQVYLLSRYIIHLCKKYNKDNELVTRFITMYLINEKSRTVRELADLFSVNHSFMSAFISKLEKKGLIRKKPHKDNRFRLIELTSKGKEATKSISRLGGIHAQGLFNKMPEEEVEQLEKLIIKINKKHDFKKDLDAVMGDNIPV